MKNRVLQKQRFIRLPSRYKGKKAGNAYKVRSSAGVCIQKFFEQKERKIAKVGIRP